MHRPAFKQETNLHAEVPSSCGKGDLVHASSQPPACHRSAVSIEEVGY